MTGPNSPDRPRSGSAPDLSFVVVTHNNPEDAYATLVGFVEQCGECNAEFLIVDESRDSSAWATAKRMRVSHPSRHIAYLSTRGEGEGAARRCGLRSARGDLVVFASAGSALSPHWLTDALAAMFDHPRAAALAGKPGQPWLCRRSALREAGGFDAGVRSARDADRDALEALRGAGHEVLGADCVEERVARPLLQRAAALGSVSVPIAVLLLTILPQTAHAAGGSDQATFHGPAFTAGLILWTGSLLTLGLRSRRQAARAIARSGRRARN